MKLLATTTLALAIIAVLAAQKGIAMLQQLANLNATRVGGASTAAKQRATSNIGIAPTAMLALWLRATACGNPECRIFVSLAGGILARVIGPALEGVLRATVPWPLVLASADKVGPDRRARCLKEAWTS